MKKYLFVLGLAIVNVILCTALVWAEEDNKELSWEEKYKDQSVMRLLSEATIELRDDWSFKIREHYKLKIQKEAGKSWGEIPIYYNKSRQKVTNIKAYTITPDGKKHRYSKIQDFKVYKGYPMYSDYRVKAITMPEVTVGSIIEYEKTTITKGLSIKDAFWYMASFDVGTPIKEDKFTITLPKKLNIRYKEFNLEHKPTIKEDDRSIIYSWCLKDLEERKGEELTPPPDLDNIKNCVEFSSIESWKDISDWYYGLVEKNTMINSKIENKVEELVEDKETIKDKVKAILEYLQEDFRYVSMSLGKYTLEPHPTDEVFKNKYGDCKDQSLLCKSMLKIAGIDSNIALFRGEFSITDPQYDLPFPNLFNHVLLEVQDPSGNFYVDPLLDGYDIGEYPGNYQAAYTFVITEDGGRFDKFPIFDEKRFYSKLDSIIEIKKDGSAVTEAVSLWKLDFSIEMRNDWQAMNQDDKDELLQILDARATYGGKMIDRRWENIDSRYGPVKSYYKYEKPKAYPIIDDMIIINSGGYGRGYDFLKEERKNPIFFPGNALDEESTTYILPEGFKVTHVPEDLDLDIGFFSFKKNYKVEGNKVIVTEATKYARKEIPVEKYSEVRDFYNKLPQKTDQRIVASKIENRANSDFLMPTALAAQEKDRTKTIEAGIIITGMTEQEIVQALGEPLHKSPYQDMSIWWYPDRKFIYFRDGEATEAIFPIASPKAEL